MGRSGVRGERSRPDGRGEPVTRAGELGWDESLYEDGGGPATADAPTGGGGHRGHRRKGARPKRRRGFRILRWAAGVLAVLVLGTAGAGYLWYQHLNSNIKTGKLNIGDHKAPKPTPNAAGQTPLNILLIGSDSRNSKEDLKLGGSKASVGAAPLADVQMLVHLSADRSNMSVVSMPRDTLTTLPKCTDPETGKVYPATTIRGKTNASLTHGGAGCTVATWEQITGIHIDHYLMIDFSGVVSMADAVGGVPVCVNANVYSHGAHEGSGLKLKKGTTYVKGVQALQWLRTRHGFEDGSDIARAKAQHMYMSALVRQLRKNATFTHPNKLRQLAETATEAIKPDDGLDSVKKLYDLSNELKKPHPKRITMTTMPFRYVGANVEATPAADTLWRMLREDVALDGKKSKKTSQVSDDPAAADDKIAVQVRNGTRTTTTAAVPGRASTVTQVLTGKGFAEAVADQSQSLTVDRTVINFPSSDLEGDAQAVAKALGIPLSSVKKSTDVSGVTLTVGADWKTGDAYPKSASEDDASKTLDKEQTQNGADDSKCMKVDPKYTW
ncbi:LCP family protein [Streptomyces sp. VRA16 Mangrove soil]|uniref:LCP family protein n=1 Tax=Streptomyces sp. VRA16 Mangrove soil TaxID=2817434 RepID=UPI001A9FAB28|nr:LCP family protein [Streptomyces sp. VRA16 Mangrove soil]MBO1336649.1 LCP family protein [Streptomyces sp. VRA16 Mangrove soil]